MGDSVLDTFYWISNKKRDVRFEVEKELGENHHKDSTCINYAVDESQIRHVLYGIRPNPGYIRSRRWNNLEPYPMDHKGIVRPLTLLKTLKDPTHVLLAIGGNDARVAFVSSFDINRIYDSMEKEGIIQNFERLVREIKGIVPNVILVIVYHPKITVCPLLYMLPNRRTITELIVRFSPMFFDIAKKFSLPVIDLARTFNPYDSLDYGSSPIEPSNKSGEYIASLTRHVIQNFPFGEGKAMCYRGVKGEEWRPLTEEIIDDSWNDLTRYRESIAEHLAAGRANSGPGCVIS